MLTIAQFADRTGIAASALRFYERKGLLPPAGRRENGYRYYEPGQVEVAQRIHSFRQAGIGLSAIRDFLLAGDVEREGLLDTWRRDARARLLAVELAERYLRGVEAAAPQIHLQRWDEPSRLLWFPASGPLRPLPFQRAAAERRRLVEAAGIPVLGSGFVRTIDLAGDRLLGEVGVRIPAAGPRRLPAAARVEAVEPCLLALLECTPAEEKAAHRLFRLLADFGFSPSGFHLERYVPRSARTYQLLVGIRKAEDYGAGSRRKIRSSQRSTK